MKIYTYYDNIQHKYQKKLISLWELSWRNAGFIPIILSIKDAEQHVFYQTFITKIKDIYLQIIGKNIGPYGLSCYTRWLAYAAQEKEYFYVSDYDCINNGFTPKLYSQKLYLMDADCPCFASGSPEQFENLCHLFIDLTLQRLEYIKSKANQMAWYHDQEFCTYNLIGKYNPDYKELLEQQNIQMTRDIENHISPILIHRPNSAKVLHISHHNIATIKNIIPYYQKAQDNILRCYLAKKVVYDKNFILR